MASDRTSTMWSPYNNCAIIATKRGKCASSRKLTVGKRVANARPFETVLLLPRHVMLTSSFIFKNNHNDKSWNNGLWLCINTTPNEIVRPLFRYFHSKYYEQIMFQTFCATSKHHVHPFPSRCGPSACGWKCRDSKLQWTVEKGDWYCPGSLWCAGHSDWGSWDRFRLIRFCAWLWHMGRGCGKCWDALQNRNFTTFTIIIVLSQVMKSDYVRVIFVLFVFLILIFFFLFYCVYMEKLNLTHEIYELFINSGGSLRGGGGGGGNKCATPIP